MYICIRESICKCIYQMTGQKHEKGLPEGFQIGETYDYEMMKNQKTGDVYYKIYHNFKWYNGSKSCGFESVNKNAFLKMFK